MRTTSELPYLTAALPGTGGLLKASPEDFLVEERPLYEPIGEGEHLYLRIEKRGISTFDAVREVARALGVSPRDVGVAGLKDAAAVARQTLSLAGVSESRARGLALRNVTVLDAKRHTNKLRMGHLKGNFFRITLRDTTGDAVQRARSIVAILVARGVPNFYGPQRFGVAARNVTIGRALVRKRFRRAVQALFAPSRLEEGSAVGNARRAAFHGDYQRSLSFFPQGFIAERNVAVALRRMSLDAWGGGAADGEFAKVFKEVPRRFVEFYVSALQAHLFNEALKNRFDTFDMLLAGDLAWLHAKGAVFLVQDPAAEAPRAAALEISPSGPIFGPKMAVPQGVPADIESRILSRAHVAVDDFRRVLDVDAMGARRPLRIPLAEAMIEHGPSADSLVISFFLPKGAFATTVLREVMKSNESVALVPEADE